TARRMMDETGILFPLVEAPAEAVPLPDASFDLAISEYGASLWADPARWLPEAARLLRPGGRLIFLTNSVLAYLCSPDEGNVVDRLLRDQFGMYRIKWPGEDGIEYHLAHSEWIARLRANGFAIEALHEPQPPAGATTHGYYDYVTAAAPTASAAAPTAAATLPPPETTSIRLAAGACDSAIFGAERYLREEGFTDIQFTDVATATAITAGNAHVGNAFPQSFFNSVESGPKVVSLGGLHPGCNEIWAQPGIASVKDLKGRTITVTSKALAN